MTTLLLRSLLLLLVGVASANPSANQSSNLLRGRNNGRSLSNDDWVVHPTDRNRRRRRLRPIENDGEDDCLMVLKLIDYEDNQLDEEVWACEFPHQFAVEVLNGNEFLDITGIAKDVLDAFHPISGASILNTRHAFVEQALDTKVMTLIMPEQAQASIHINVLDETHPRHYKQRRRNRNRNLQDDPNNRALGEMSVLVVKVVDTNGLVNPLEATMSEDWFGTSTFTFKSGFEQCSHNQLIMKPATNIQVPYCGIDDPCSNDAFCNFDYETSGFCEDCPPNESSCSRMGLPVNGVADCKSACAEPSTKIRSPFNVYPVDTYPANSQIENGVLTVTLDIAVTGEDLQNKAIAAAEAAMGGSYSQYDLVAFCQPPNGGWVAYAYVNSYASFFNGRWCNRPSAQLHEIGHNLNMGHSNEPNRAGSQNNIVEGSRQDAFVGGTYGDQSALMAYSYDISDGPKMCFNAPKSFQFGWYVNQQLSYDPLLPSNIDTPKKLTLNGVNEYKTNGAATNGKLINVRLVQDGDTYNTTLRTYGRDYYIGFNDAYGINTGTIEGRNQVLLFVKDTGGPNEYGESSRLAGLDVGQSVTIKDYGSTKTTLADITISFESLTNNGRDANIIITTLQPQSQLTPGPINPPTSDSPSASPSSKPSASPMDATPPPSKVPTTKPTDPPTSSPVQSPTPAPVSQPTSSPINVCENSKDTVYVNKKGKKKKCNWVKAGKTLKIRKKRCTSKKYSYLGKRIKENCPKACGEFAGKGICKNLFVSPFGKNKNK